MDTNESLKATLTLFSITPDIEIAKQIAERYCEEYADANPELDRDVATFDTGVDIGYMNGVRRLNGLETI